MKKFSAWFGLQLVVFGIKILESVPFGLLDERDKADLQRLWNYYDNFKSKLGEQ